MRILYVAGYGRSGSTLLDRQIAGSATVFSAGELARLFGNAQQGGALATCSCGARYADCPCWGPLLDRLLTHPHGGSLAALERITRGAETAAPESLTPGVPDWDRYAWLWGAVLDHLASATGRTVLVDSSKTTPGGSAYRPLLLARITGQPVILIHLLRDPGAVLHSASKGSNKALERGETPGWVGRQLNVVRAYLSWRGANERALWLGRQPRIRRLVMTYDAFCADPSLLLEQVNAIAREAWGAALPPDDGGGAGDHGVGGNRLRRAAARPIEADNAWRREASLLTRALGARHRAALSRFVAP